MTRPLARLALLGMLALACGDDGNNDTAAGTTVVPPSTGSDTTASATTESAEAESTGAPAECEAVACGEGELCVVPTCCNGPEPTCSPLPAGGDCGNGSLDENGSNCCIDATDPQECMQTQWCLSGPCIPDPPFCVGAEMVTCDFGSGVCMLQDVCSGPLQSGALVCEPCDG